VSRHRLDRRYWPESARLLAAEGATVVTSGRHDEPPSVGESLHVAADLGRPGEPERLVREAERSSAASTAS